MIRDRGRKIFSRRRPRSRPENFETKGSRPRRETIEIETRIFFVKKFNFINDINFIFPKIRSYFSNKLASPACYKKALLYVRGDQPVARGPHLARVKVLSGPRGPL